MAKDFVMHGSGRMKHSWEIKAHAGMFTAEKKEKKKEQKKLTFVAKLILSIQL